ncbi:ABC transporter permease [Pseudoroseicyclus tamaricis]|uniref:FtsX-like permease family protein n=1 Tax=Pseudoroseicyclus tamaricis TaxID=2705421 RepID=A0A6B2K1W7_9RHOB|nr:FtsX-like permease family protein [Pseudoroseicyclus tamaricis]NDV02494.1 FtsX-like permease family protein [Pseudoroseicyclus tamaricis]
MSLAIAGRLARRELRGGLRGFAIFLACLALGVAAIAALGSVRAAITAGLEQEGARLLGGDAEMTFTYRFATEDELAYMDEISRARSELVEFRSLATIGEGETSERALTQVEAIDGAYPLIGSVTLDPPMPLAEALAGSDLPGAVMEPLLADRLGLAPGDSFRLGEQEFRLTAIVESYPDNAAGGFGFGPKTFVLTEALAGSGLISEGTLFETKYRLLLPPEADLNALQQEVRARFRDSGVRWEDSRGGADGAEEFVDRLAAFLILMGLAGLAVGGVGISSAVRAYLSGKTATIATLRSLGAARSTVFLTYLIQIGALSLLGIAIGLVLGAVLPLLLAPVIGAALPIPAVFTVYPGPLAEAALYGGLTALIFTLWPLARTEEVGPAALFRDASAGGHLPRPRYLLATAVLLAALVASAAWLSDSVELTLWTAGGIAGALAALALSAVALRWLARRLARPARGRPALRLALGAVGARGGETLSTVLALGLGLAVLAAVGQIDGNMRRAITGELPQVAPSYFFIDIQPDQMEGFMARLDGDAAVSRVDAAPMLRGVITAINDVPASELPPHWVLRSDRGLTYSEEVPERARITAGEWWPPGYDGPPQISFSAAEAAELGLELGDVISMNILGREFSGTVTSFREVDFNSAGIGFVMSMNPSALAGAPHSFIATVYAEEAAEAAILRDLANAYPNITAISIREAVEEAARLLGGIAAATRYGAGVTLLTGFLVLIGAAAAGERQRAWEAALLKTLGASRARILLSFALRATFLGLCAGIVALAAGMAGGWAVMEQLMDLEFVPVWGNALFIVAFGALASLLAGLAFALRPLAAKPAQVLRARE